MKCLNNIVAVVVVVLASQCGAVAQPAPSLALGFYCIGTYNTTNMDYECAGGSKAALRNNSATVTVVTASVGGFYKPGDNGGGDYVDIGDASSKCYSTPTGMPASGTGTVGLSKIGAPMSFPYNNLTAGEAISGGGGGIQIPPGAEVAAWDSGAQTLTLTLPLIGTASGSTLLSFTVTGDNGGTLILDSTPTNPQCWQKTNYHGDPHEWGAYGDGSTDDTIALENWLGSLGPWDATIPAMYLDSAPLTCGPGVNLRAPANDSQIAGNSPLVEIIISTHSGTSFPTGTPSDHNAVLTAWANCRLSGLAINAAMPSGTVNNGNVDAVMIGPNLSTVGSSQVPAIQVVVDSHTLLQHGYYNLSCGIGLGNNGGVGLQLKDSQFDSSWSDNVAIGCANVRLIGDIFNNAGADFSGSGPPSQAGIHFLSDDMTLMGGVVETASGPGVSLDSAQNVSVTGMYIDTNGQKTDSPGVLISSSSANTAHTISICGNHFHENDYDSGNGASLPTAHVRFQGPASGAGAADNVSFCGNVYEMYNKGQVTPYPNYVYDVTGTPPTNVYLSENSEPQVVGVFSPGAASALLPQRQALPGTSNNQITGLTMSNGSAPHIRINIAPGQAVDSTNSFVISLANQCPVIMNSGPGPGGIDVSSSASASTTYFFFVIAGPTVKTNCIASASTVPNLSTAQAQGYIIYRMVGALYTDALANLVQFAQNDDTFTLDTSVQFGATLGITGIAVPISSVPAIISVDAFGRCETSGTVGPIMLSAGNVAAQRPSSTFSTIPGYMVDNTNPVTAFAFSLYTLGNPATPPLTPPGGTINGAGAGPGVGLTCYNDGWIWHRGK